MMNKKLVPIVCFLSTYVAYSAQSAPVNNQAIATQTMIEFFSNMPQAVLFPSDYTTTIKQVFTTTLGLPATITDPIEKLYSLLAQQATHAYIDANYPTFFDTLADTTMALAKAQTANDMQEAQTQQAALTKLKQQMMSIIQTNVAPQLTTTCLQSSCWQNYLKMFIASSFDYEVTLLSQLHTNEEQMFLYIPQFETAYYSDAYVKLRNGSETLRIFLIITDQIRQRILPLITDWHSLAPSDLYDKIQTFKTTDFYTLATRFHEATTADPVVIKSPLMDGSNIARGFKQYVYLDNNTPTVVPSFASIMTISQGQLSLVGAGTLLFKEATLQDKTGSSYATLVTSQYFPKLFQSTGAGYTPTDLYMELLIIEGAKMLVGATSYLFNRENVADTMQKLSTVDIASRGLATNSTSSAFPTFLMYQPEDQLLLEDLGTCIAQNNALNPDTQLSAESFWHDLCHAFRHAFDAIGHAFATAAEAISHSIENIAKKVGDFVVHIATAVADVGKSLYYLTGLNCLVSGMAGDGFNHYSLSNFNKYLADSASQLSDCVDDITSIVSDVASVAEDVVNLSATIVGQVAGAILMDPQLATDLTGLIDTIADTVINLTANTVNFFVKAVGDYVVLSYEGIETLTRVIVDTLTGNIAEAGQALSQMVHSVVSSILNLASFVLSSLGSALKSVMTAIAYLVSCITDVVIDVSGYLAAAFTGNWQENWKMRHTLSEHRQLMNAIIMTGLAVAITVATFGAGAEMGGAMIALAIAGGVMTVGMSVLQIMSAVQQDTQSTQRTDAQIEFLTQYEPYVMNNVRVTTAMQNKIYAESLLKFETQENNQERGLVYYQNYLNAYYNNTYAIQAYNLSSFYNVLLTPDGSTGQNPGIAPGDAGYWYGIQTQRYDINPSRGFRTYQVATNTFTQEIAAAPAPSSTITTSTSTSVASALIMAPGQQSTTQSWLNQRDNTLATAQDLKNIDIRWRVIYDMDAPFYIGIYATEKYIDPNQLQALHANFLAQQTTNPSASQFTPTWKALSTYNQALLSFNDDAKCCVMYKGMDQVAPLVGIYEHNQKGWLATSSTIPYERGAWYRMQVTLEAQSATTSQLTAQCWKEETPGMSYAQAQHTWTYGAIVQRAQVLPAFNTQETQTLTTSTTSTGKQTWTAGWHVPTPALATQTTQYAGSFGVITSGAAVEYQILSPQPTIQITAPRTASNNQVAQDLQNNGVTPNEQTRERTWQKSFEELLYPVFGEETLNPANQTEIQSGIYIYTTNNTQLNKGVTDYVVFLSALTPVLQPTNIGVSIQSNPQYIVSLITGNVYDTKWQLQSQTYPQAFDVFRQNNSVAPQLLTTIQKTVQNYYTYEAGPFAFANLTLTGVTSAFATGAFIYTAPSLTPELSGTDYFVTAYFDATQNNITNSNLGLNPNQNNPINALISLVTGTMFTLDQNGSTITSLQLSQTRFIQITTTTTSYPMLYTTLQTSIPMSIQTSINAQQTVYKNAVAAAQQKQQPQQQPQPQQVQTVNLGGFSAFSTGGNFGGLQDGGGSSSSY